MGLDGRGHEIGPGDHLDAADPPPTFPQGVVNIFTAPAKSEDSQQQQTLSRKRSSGAEQAKAQRGDNFENHERRQSAQYPAGAFEDQPHGVDDCE